jgi:hypothetical protein
MVTRVSSGRRAYIALGVVLASVASVALAATFNLFSPASGILKGNPSTYITTAATSADVVATFSGTCNSGTVLKGDGSCAAASSGTVTSVALTAPTGLTVTGSPVTSSGTLALSTTLSGVVHGNGSGFTAGNVALGSEVSGLLPVANGGIGVGTLTGIAKGNGTSAFTSAVASDVYGLWAGGCSSSNFLRGDGTCASPGGGGTVTSVAMSVPAFLSVTGSPVTSSGTLAVSLSGTALPVLNGGTGTTTSTGTGSVVLSASPTLSGTITGGTFSGTFSGNGASVTSLDAGNVSAGTLAVARGGTGTTTSTGTGSVVLSASPTLTGTVTAATVAASAVTVGGNNVCQSTGTNCPASTGAAIVSKFSSSNTVRNNSASPTTDTNLTGFVLLANKSYQFTGNLSVGQISAAAGFRTALTCSAGSQTSGNYNIVAYNQAGTTVASASDSTTQQIGVAMPSGTFGIVHINGAITAGGSGCTLDFQWSQNVATASNTTINSGGSAISFIQLN